MTRATSAAMAAGSDMSPLTARAPGMAAAAASVSASLRPLTTTGPFGGAALGGGPSDAARRPGDHHDPSLEEPHGATVDPPRYAPAVRFGIHLPQFGRAAVAGAVRGGRPARRGARLRRRLGQRPPRRSRRTRRTRRHTDDPLVSLAFARRASPPDRARYQRARGPQYTSPLALANTLASLDNLSGAASPSASASGGHAPSTSPRAASDHRGDRLDEIIDLFRTAWTDDPPP